MFADTLLSKAKRIASIGVIAGVAAISSAHVGSPNVVFDGNAGPYAVRVVVKPPEVVPGLADVIVRIGGANANDVQRVMIRPVFWRAGEKGAPAGDEAPRVAGQQSVYTGRLWLMSRGSYSVYVTVNGPRGSGTAIVPVNAFATGRLALSPGLAGTLIALAGVLFVGLVTIVRAAAGESLVAPGERIDPKRRRTANVTALVFAPLLAIVLFGGAKWWKSVDADYSRTMFRPPEATPTISADRTLSLTLRDTAAFRALFSAVIPDHGKMMHLFLIKDGDMSAFVHLHPVQTESYGFTTTVPDVPPGRYRLFGDVTLENGTSLTVTNTVELPAVVGKAPSPRDPDDSWSVNAPIAHISPTASVLLDDGKHTMTWVGTASPLVANQPVDLSFLVKNSDNSAATLQPYLGMSAHAVVMRDDASVFIHLHPMGTISTASQQVFALRDRGDTTAAGHLNLDSTSAHAMEGMSAMPSSGAFTIPYDFPKSGHYRMWVQVKADNRVLTGTFDAVVR
ncbi:MAG TPA: hypothetical protein VGM50_14565 [Gemmatimonadaceae bacterium]